jgi:flavin-binding protein dodecin
MNVIKVIEVMASSNQGWEDAARNAVKSAGKSVKGIRSVYIKEQSAVVHENNITEFRVTCKLTFEVFESGSNE